jgi:hypothetical protein
MRPVNHAIGELARARADVEGHFNSPVAVGNLAVAGSMAAEVFFDFEVPRLHARASRVSRAILEVAATRAMRGVE